MKCDVAICIGHKGKGTGATSWNGVDEWEYNCGVGAHLQNFLTDYGISSFIGSRDTSHGYSQAMKTYGRQCRYHKAKVAVELHFNAAHNSAHGSETLYYRKSSRGGLLAHAVADSLHEEFPDIALRGNRGTKPRLKTDRGGKFLYYTPCPAIIPEPFFATNPSDWSKVNRGGIARAIARGVKKYLEYPNF